VTVQKQSTNFIMGAGVYSERGRIRLAVHVELHRRVRPRLAQARAGRGRRHDLRRAEVLDAPLARSGAAGRRRITAGDVVNALREQNVQVAAGSVGDSPAREGQPYQISVRAAGRLREVAEFENIIVKAGPAGRSCG
jgi:hydrophobic/amphiphilic exporter-1 (mainly G- bacteria), HAE1 family